MLGIIKIYQSAHQLSKVNQKPTPPAEPHFPPHCPFKHPLLFPFTSSPPTLRQKFLHCAGRRNGSKIQKEHPPIRGVHIQQTPMFLGAGYRPCPQSSSCPPRAPQPPRHFPAPHQGPCGVVRPAEAPGPQHCQQEAWGEQ